MAKRRGRKEGSIWKQSGFWRAAISLDGHRMTRSFKTKEECKAWIREVQNQIDEGLTFNTTQVSLSEFMEKWLSVHASRLRRKTGPQYQQITRDYILPYLGKYKLKDLRLDHIESVYRSLLKKGVGSRTVRYAHSILHRCLNDAQKRGLLGYNPAHGAVIPRAEHHEMYFLDEDQVMRFLLATKESRYEALYHLAVKTGMRQGELLGLKWSDLDWKKGILRVQRQLQRINNQGLLFSQPKTKTGNRSIQLGEQTLQTLRTHLEKQRLEQAFANQNWRDEGLIFATPIATPTDPRNLIRDYKRVLRIAGLREIRFHDLRHTAASLMLNNGVPILVVSKILGHSKASTTLDIYGHLISVMQEGAARMMDELITPIPVDLGNVEVVKTPPDTSKQR
jgi:integrase